MSSKRKKHYYVIGPCYFDKNLYMLKIAFIIYNREGEQVWYTKRLLGPTSLKRMLYDKGKELAEEHNTRLLTGIKKYQPFKRADYRKGVQSYELL